MLVNITLLLFISLAWASGYLFIGTEESALAPFTMSAMMTGVAAVVLLVTVPLLFRRSLLEPIKKSPCLVAVLSITTITIPELSVVIAEQWITADMASLVGTSVPIFTFLIATFIMRTTQYSHLRMVGVVVAVSGVITYVGWHEIISDMSEVEGILIMMSGGLVFALNGFLITSKANRIDQYALAATVVTISAILLALLALVFEREVFAIPNAKVMWSVVTAGAISSGLAYLGYFVLLGRTDAHFMSLYAYLVPIFGFILGVLFLDQSLTLNHFIGLIAVLAGLWLLIRGDDGRAKEVSPHGRITS